MLWYPDTLLKESDDGKNLHVDMVSLLEEEEPNGNKRNGKVQRKQACQNPKKYIPPVSLFLCHITVAQCCFIWSLALRMWSVSECVR